MPVKRTTETSSQDGGLRRRKTPKMTRQHFVFLAETLHTAIERSDMLDRPVVLAFVRRFVDRLEETNSAFNRDRFLKACGIDPTGTNCAGDDGE